MVCQPCRSDPNFGQRRPVAAHRRLSSSFRSSNRRRFTSEALMNRLVRLLLSVALLSAGSNLFGSESFSSAVVLSEPGFPVADSAPASLDQLRQALPDAQFISTKQLPALLGAGTTRLFVLPYGSAFPEESWAVIHKFLQDGGNLLVLGGRPFTRSAYRNLDGWKLRDYSV